MAFELCPSSKLQKAKTRYRALDLFFPGKKCEDMPTLLGL